MARLEHDASRLINQFVLTRSPAIVPPTWRDENQRGWHLATHGEYGLPILPLLDAAEASIGWLVGFPVDDARGLLRCQYRAGCRADGGDFASRIEDVLYALGGRFAAILLTNEIERVYLDPCGSLPAVYSPGSRAVCSTTSVLPDASPEDARHEAVVEALGIPRRDHWYPFGLTARPDAERILPNHYLDLQTWKTVRHWPRGPIERLGGPDGTRPIIEKMRKRIERLATNLTRSGAVTMDLTAGRDSRMLAACARPVVDRIEFLTTRLPDRAGRMDVRVASVLAERHQFRHTVVNWREADEAELRLWQYRTGYCLAGRTWRAVSTGRQAGVGSFHVTGHAGEVGRAFYWKSTDREEDRPAGEDIVGRLHLPVLDSLSKRAEAWLSDLREYRLSTILDLLYLEQRVGCWATPMFYGHVAPISVIIPFNHRETIDGLVRLPVGLKADQGVPAAVIADSWPELLDVPFNQFVGIERVVDEMIAPLRRFGSNHPRIGRLLRLNHLT